ncbi:Cupin 1 [Dillenia turbinata]|uniref:Germin-like protein n=1 Tax=Dillenia turbinata TaxID=194707 RepID=A0AAN8UL45_9MAGN
MQIPRLNIMGLSMVRIDYKPGGLNPRHTHSRGTKIIFVLEGELEVGFITTADVLITKTIKKGEIFMFLRGLIHFQKNNNGDKLATVIAAFNNQLPGTQVVLYHSLHRFRLIKEETAYFMATSRQAAFLSKLEIEGTSLSNQQDNVLVATIIAPSTKLSPPFDN